MSSFLIAPSILSANLARLGEEVQSVLDAGADMIHIDVMDNHYVPNLTFGPVICESLRNYGITAPFDVHLMIEPVDEIIPAFAKSKVDIITFHPEATKHIHRTIQLIHSFGVKAGLALNPATPLSHLDHVIHDLDMILLMSVNPGFGGQEFIPETLEKVRETRRIIDASNKKIRLEVDGGVNLQNIKEIAQAGADTFVLGTAIFKTPNYKNTITSLNKALNDISK